MKERKKPSQSWIEKSIEEIEKEAFNKGWEAGLTKACEWFEKYLFDIGYPDDWCRDSQNLISGKERFIKAMEEEV